MFCKCGYFATSRITQIIKCPICPRSILVFSLEDQGRFAWYQLHTKANPTADWYENQWKRYLIPRHDCECRSKFNKLTAKRPPDFAAFGQWAIDIHNDVNRSLGKPVWEGSLADALRMSFAITLVVDGSPTLVTAENIPTVLKRNANETPFWTPGLGETSALGS